MLSLGAANFSLWQLEQTDDTSVAALIKRVKDAYGKIDFLFLNAGKGHCRDKRI